jgi:hypothetical protein
VLPLRSYRKRGGINENASVCGLFDSYRVRRITARVSRHSSCGWGFPQRRWSFPRSGISKWLRRSQFRPGIQMGGPSVTVPQFSSASGFARGLRPMAQRTAPWLGRPSGKPNYPRSTPIWLRSIRLSHQMSEPPAFRRVPLCSRFHWFQRPRTTPGRGITPGLLTTQTCDRSRQQRIQTGWRPAKTFWIKIVSSRGHSLQAGTISSSATTRSDRFRQPFGDWGSIPVKSMEFLDLTLDARSKTTRSRTSCR